MFLNIFIQFVAYVIRTITTLSGGAMRRLLQLRIEEELDSKIEDVRVRESKDAGYQITRAEAVKRILSAGIKVKLHAQTV